MARRRGLQYFAGAVETENPNSPADEVVPFADSQELLRSSGLPESAVIVVGTGHRLADHEPVKAMLKAMLEAVERVR